MFSEKIKYCVNVVKQLMDKDLSTSDEFNQMIEEMMLFDSSLNIYDLQHKCSTRRHLLTSKILYQQIILKEIENIKTFKKATGELEQYLSEYGSLYCGDGILYYSDTLVNYNNEQFLQIIINHINHYIHGCISNDRNELLIKSNTLLSFYHLGLIDCKIAYSKSCRSTLYEKPQYQKVINDIIIFVPNNNYKSFVINNVCETKFYKVYEDIICGFNLLISESWITSNKYDYKIKNKIKSANRKYKTDSENNCDDLLVRFNIMSTLLENNIKDIIAACYCYI